MLWFLLGILLTLLIQWGLERIRPGITSHLYKIYWDVVRKPIEYKPIEKKEDKGQCHRLDL